MLIFLIFSFIILRQSVAPGKAGGKNYKRFGGGYEF